MTSVQFGTLRSACEDDQMSVLPRAVALAHLDIAARLMQPDELLGVVRFEQEFPDRRDATDPRRDVFGSHRLYRDWRNAMLKLLICCGGATRDQFRTLKALGRAACPERNLADLQRPLERAFGSDVVLAEITRSAAIAADGRFSGTARRRFRRAVAHLDWLREIQEVRALGLLDATPIGPMPAERPSGRRAVPLPPRLAAFSAGISPVARTAVKAVYETGVACGAFNPEADIMAHDLLAPPAGGSIARALHSVLPKATVAAYLARTARALRAERGPVQNCDGWAELRFRARTIRPGINLDPLRHMRKRSVGRAPQALDQLWFDREVGAATPAHAAELRQGARLMNHLRDFGDEAMQGLLPKGAFIVTGPREQLPSELRTALSDWSARTAASASQRKLMRGALRVLYRYQRTTELETLLMPNVIDEAFAAAEDMSQSVRARYRAAAVRFAEAHRRDPAFLWEELIASAVELLNSRGDLHALGALRSAAQAAKPPRGPADLDGNWVRTACAKATAKTTRNRLRRGVLVIDRLRTALPAGLRPRAALGPLPDGRRRGHASLPCHIRDGITEHARFRGLAPNSTRALQVAVQHVFSRAHDKSVFDRPLAELPLEAIISDIEGRGTLAPNQLATWARTRATALRLSRELTLSWTPDWAALQEQVVGCGVAAPDNPIPDLARTAIADEIGSPQLIDREWAWQTERGLRPDLRLTWSRDIERFDALYAHHALRACGLMPDAPLGPMPKRGQRARHGLFPLPRPIETVVDRAADTPGIGYSWQQLNEAAHLVWRHARELGRFARSDAPDVAEMFSEAVVSAVFAQAELSARMLDEHARRVSALIAVEKRKDCQMVHRLAQ